MNFTGKTVCGVNQRLLITCGARRGAFTDAKRHKRYNPRSEQAQK
jgi:hypothetical protein